MWSRRDVEPFARTVTSGRAILRVGFAAGLALSAIVFLPAEASAQRVAHPAARPGGHAVAVRRPVYSGSGYYRPAYYRPYYYRPYYYGYPYYYGPSFAFGLSFGWYGGYGWPAYYGFAPYGYYGPAYSYGYPYPYYYDYNGSARLQIAPREAEVYVDGYLAGTVDNFDGRLQRLHVPSGEHELQVYLKGYRTYRQKVLFRPGATVSIQHALQPLAAGEQGEERPTPPPRSAQPPLRHGDSHRPPAATDHYPPARHEVVPQAPAPGESAYGAIAVRVQPMNAEVLVNGERWESPQAGDLTLQLAEGTYQVEVRREGFRPYSATIRVRRGETTSLNVSLSRQ
jgi:PEGA domain